MTSAARKRQLRLCVRIAARHVESADARLQFAAHEFSIAREESRRAHKHLLLRIGDARKGGAL